MKRFAAVAVAVVAVSLTGAKLLITEYQAIVMGSLEEMKFQFEPPPRNVVGAPPVFTATDETLKFLKGRKFQIQGDGSIKELKTR